jgi:methionyl-tRNA synthetase
MINRMNRDLANDYGNLVQRVLALIQRNCSGRLPTPAELLASDRELLDASSGLLEQVRAAMAVQALGRSLEAIFELVGAANRYVDAEAPWVLRRTDPARMATVLHTLVEIIRRLALLTQAFMPDASARILDQLGIEQGARSLKHYHGTGAALRPGAALPKPIGVFPRFPE